MSFSPFSLIRAPRRSSPSDKEFAIVLMCHSLEQLQDLFQ